MAIRSPRRRDLLILSAASGFAPRLGRAANAAGGLEPEVVIRTTGGVFEAALKKNFFDPFTKATGVRVVPFASSYGDMMAKAAANAGRGPGRVGHHLAAVHRTRED